MSNKVVRLDDNIIELEGFSFGYDTYVCYKDSWCGDGYKVEAGGLYIFIGADGKGCICEKGGGRRYGDALLKKVKDITVWDLGKYIKKGVGIYFVDSKAKKEWLEVLMR